MDSSLVNCPSPPDQHEPTPISGSVTVETCVRESVERYLAALDGHACQELYHLVVDAVERPLLATVMQHCQDNLSAAAAILGINRATLRKKLLKHRLIAE